MVDYVYVDGQRCTPYMAYQIFRLKADFRARFGLEIYVSSGLRLYAEQVAIFLARYVTAGNINGRYVYDTRVWNGVKYYRISPDGTVAVPSTSNHEIQGTNGAADFADTGRDAGVSRANNERSNWLRSNAGSYDMEPEGYSFGEPWHYKIRNIFQVPPGGSNGVSPVPSRIPKDDEMLALRIKDASDRIHMCTIGIGVFRHLIQNDDPERMKNIIKDDDQWTDIHIAELDRLLWTFGCDLGSNVYRIIGSEFQVYNPVDGSWRAGNMWSSVNARFAALRK